MICINEHKVGSEGRVTYRTAELVDGAHLATEPLAPDLRREAYFTWEQSADLRDTAGHESAFHPGDWDWSKIAWLPGHPSIDDVLASRGYDEDGTIHS